jgi:hypothetical protein
MKPSLTTRVFGRRRSFLVHPAYQHRLSLFTALLALLPPSLFFGIYYLITSEGSNRIIAASPSLETLVRGQDRTEILLILCALLFYGLGVYLVALLETHRTAGFLFRVDRRLNEIESGQYAGQIHPRREDNFAHIAESVNRLSRTLKRRAEEDAAVLEDLGQALDAALHEASAGGGRARDRLAGLRSRLEALQCLKRAQLGLDAASSLPPGLENVTDGLADSGPPAPRVAETAELER